MKPAHPHLVDLATLLLASITITSTSWSAASQATFQGLGDLPGGAFMSEAIGISPDGGTVVGLSAGTGGVFAFKWTVATGMVALPSSPNGVPVYSAAAGASADGLLVSGSSNGTNGGACIWAGGGIIPLGDSGDTQTYGGRITPDGSVVVGQRTLGGGQFKAFRWTAASGIVALEGLPGGGDSDVAIDVSDDGNVVVGGSTSFLGTEAFRWTQDTGMIAIADLPGGATFAQLWAITPDATVGAGRATSASGQEATRWTVEHGLVGLGDLPGGAFSSFGRDISSDGAVIVGHGTTELGDEAFVWDEGRGMRSLKHVLEVEHGLDVTGWTLSRAYAISRDGTTIAGYGTNPQGNVEAWHAVVPRGFCACPGAGTVLGQGKISSTAGGFGGPLDNADLFGRSVAYIGDLDADGISELAVGAYYDDDGGMDRGAVWVLFMNGDGTVKIHQKISGTAGGFSGLLDDGDLFGIGVAALGDLDSDGNADLAVGALNDDDGGTDRGAVWVLFLNRDGTVKAHQKISSIAGDFAGPLDDFDSLGFSVASPGDIDGDRIADLAVGAFLDDDGGMERGAVWILFLNANGTVKAHQKISSTFGGFTGRLDDSDTFGSSVTSPGDVDNDGIVDLAVGAYQDDDGGTNCGAVWMLFLHADGAVKAHQKISSGAGGFTGALDSFDDFGLSIAAPGDLDGDGSVDLVVGAYGDDDGGMNRGAVWVLLLNSDGMVKAHQKLSSATRGFMGPLDNRDRFGVSVAAQDDDADGTIDLAVGAMEDDDGGPSRGAVWILSIGGCDPTVPPLGDLDQDCVVDGADLGILLGAWGAKRPGDLDGDGVVGGADLGALLAAWTG